MDEAVLAAVKSDSYDGLKRSQADKERAVKALLARGKSPVQTSTIGKARRSHCHSVGSE